MTEYQTVYKTDDGAEIPVLRFDAAVIGSGAAGFNALDTLASLGAKNIALFTENREMGTSRNTGSDKQTYYKLSLADEEDSVAEMTRTLFAGEGVNGDTALCEAAGSVRAFMKLCELGVGFPTNEFGQYVGYKTDHDPRTRATSAGPLTSRYMTEALEKRVDERGLTVMEGYVVFRLITADGHVRGFLCWNEKEATERHHGLTVVLCPNIILCTGGPAGCYDASVYPVSQWGMSGMALAAGARGANLSEWQYGLASVDFRWNVSGTYQQVLPRYISVDEDGVEREFLPDYFASPEEALNNVFLKGYQWPFDAAKAHGSTMIDMIVYHESVTLGRKVYLDFTREPKGLERGFKGLSEEARQYLKNSHATQKTPIERLARMNPLAIDLYASHGIDLTAEPLRIAVCAQHHNGGLAVDANWETSLTGLFAAGEAAGNFGVHRPGGSALNATQVGSFRAASEIARRGDFTMTARENKASDQAARAAVDAAWATVCASNGPESNLPELRESAQQTFSRIAAQLRDIPAMKAYAAGLADTQRALRWMHPAELRWYFKISDMLETQKALISAMTVAAETFGSRGSALVLDPAGDTLPGVLSAYAFRPTRPTENLVLVTELGEDGYRSFTEPVRPIPEVDNWFENVWKRYRKRQ